VKGNKQESFTFTSEFITILIALIVVTLIAVVSIVVAVIFYRQRRHNASISGPDLLTYL